MEALKVYLSGAIYKESEGQRGNHPDGDLTIVGMDRKTETRARDTFDAVAEKYAKDDIEEGHIDTKQLDVAEKEFSGELAKYQIIQHRGGLSYGSNNLSYSSSSYMKRRWMNLREAGYIRTNKEGQTDFNWAKILEDIETEDNNNIFANESINKLGGANQIAGSINDLLDTTATALLARHYLMNPFDAPREDGLSLGKSAQSLSAIFGLYLGVDSIAASKFGEYGVGVTGLRGRATRGIAGAGRFFRGNIKKSLVGAGLLYGYGSYLRATNFKNKTMDKFSANYLIAAPLIFSRLLQEEAVTIIPLTKDGKPLSTVSSNRDPFAGWKNVLGRYVNMAEDILVGTMDNVDEMESLGNEFWKHLKKGNAQFIDDNSFKYVKSSGTLYNMIKDEE